MPMMDDEMLQVYIEESREHLQDIENDLLAIEQAGENIDEELVNKVFRAAHSMKGGAGFLGLANIKELAHKIENVLDMIRNRELVPTPEIINVILLSFDRLREMIENLPESSEMDISEHLDALVKIASGNLPREEKQSVENEVEITDSSGRSIFTVKEFDLLQAKKEGKFVYLIEFDLIHDIHRKEKNPLDIINDMQATGEVLEVKLDLEAVGTLEDDIISNKLPMYVLYKTVIEPDIISTFLNLPKNQIKHIQLNDVEDVQAQEDLPGSQSEPEIFEPEPLPEMQQVQPEQIIEETTEPEISPESLQAQQPLVRPKSEKLKPVAKPAKTVHPETLRVHVSLLENLMNLAGELVLSRNQLLQAISIEDQHGIAMAGQRIDMVTSELQEAIMLTRMQPVGNIFNKFPRVVRDLAYELGKEIELKLEGKEVELDKTIIEGLSDPLTHLVRNSADHGIEPPEERIAKGKPPQGTIILKAYHAAGQVNIEIIDDGRGMDVEKIVRKAIDKGLVTEEQLSNMSEKDKLNLIFLPGLSTAEKVSDISGRGVGMDVVKNNLDKLGGQVEIETELNKGTSIRIKLPLTLAIIPSLLISMGEDKFAIPQVNVDEMIQVPAAQVSERIEHVGDAEVLILRGELIPLMSLARVLGIDRQRKVAIADKKSALSGLDEDKVEEYSLVHSSQDVNIVVVQAGSFKYGLVVDELHDSVEIVVKPLGRHLKNCEGYAGATIMGDGRVALILDVAGLAKLGQLSSVSGSDRAKKLAIEEEKRAKKELHSLFLFNNGPEEHCAVHLDLVARIDMVWADDIEVVGGKKVIQYRGRSLPVFALEEVANVSHLELEGELVVIVFNIAQREVGLLALPPVDAVEVKLNIDPYTLKQRAISGSAIINGKTTLIVDIYELVETLCPEWFEKKEIVNSGGSGPYKVLLVEDSEFFRTHLKEFIQNEGYDVTIAEDGLVAWELLNGDPHKFDIVVTDLEMPNMDGFELTKKIKADSRLNYLPVIALTSLAGDEDVAKGKDAGVDDYQIKLDKEHLLKSIASFLTKKAA
ncbi:hybrid sensor histidine kinase/response regulator [Desulfovulcanus sp.]